MARMKKATAKKAAPKKTVKRTTSKKQAPKQELAPVPTQQNPQPPMGTPPMGANGPMMRRGGKIKKAQGGTKFAALAPPYDKATYADKIAGATKNKAKSGKTIKKAEEGTNLRKGQYRRLGRIAENNPERAERVAQRMNARASRVERGKEIANPPKMEYNPNKMREMLRSEAAKKTMKSGGKMKKCKYGCK